MPDSVNLYKLQSPCFVKGILEGKPPFLVAAGLDPECRNQPFAVGLQVDGAIDTASKKASATFSEPW